MNETERASRRDEIQGKVGFLLEHRWGGNQRRMSKDLGVSQGLVSKIVRGLQAPGKQFLERLARQPGINPNWLLQGTGSPFPLPNDGTLPIAFAVLPGPPLDFPHLLTEQRHPVARPLDRPTRYWMQIQSTTPTLNDSSLCLLAGDLVLMETDSAWTNRLDFVVGRLCGIRFSLATDASPHFLFGKVWSDSKGVLASDSNTILRLDTGSAPEPGKGSPVPSPLHGYNPFAKPRRSVRGLIPKAPTPAQGRQQDEVVATESAGTSESNRTFALKDVLGISIYLARPAALIG